MRIMLINAPVSRMSPHARVSPPMGVSYLAGHLRGLGHQVSLMDLNLSGFNPQRIRLALRRRAPQVVGISAFTETFPNALEIAREIKAFDPRITIVLGGAHPSTLPEESIARPEVDYVVVGEGERTLEELVNAISAATDATTDAATDATRVGEPAHAPDVSAIQGLVWRGPNGEPIVNPARPLLDADEIVWPARDLLSLEFYQDPFSVVTSRGGCPYRCPFCSASYVWSGKRRHRDPKLIVDELEMLVREYGASHVYFSDDIFTLSSAWVRELLAELERLNNTVTWACSTRVDRVSPELLAEMAAHGCVSIQYGVESGSQEILDSVKGIDKQSAIDAVRWTAAAGIEMTASFMIPFPEDTEETIRETFGLMDTLAGEGAQVLMSYTTPYPGTAFYDNADELGLKILTRDWGEYDAKHLVMETAHLTIPQIEHIVAREVDGRGMVRTA